MDWARQRRIDRLRSPSGHFFLLALDHPLSLGAIDGLDDLPRWLRFTDESDLTGAVVNLGAAAQLSCPFRKAMVVQLMSLPAGSPSGARKVKVGSVEDALRNGADAVAVQLWVEDPALAISIPEVAELIHGAHKLGLPALLMMSDSATAAPRFDLADKLRIAYELGADLIKVSLPASLESELRARISNAVGNVGPVLLAGGPETDRAEQMYAEAAAFGFAGACIGRHLFQARSATVALESLINAWQRSA